MRTLTTIAVDGRLVKWARESAGLSLEAAAKKAKVRPAIFGEWERTRAYRTPRQLEELANTFKRPVASFFLPEPPREPGLPADFRWCAARNSPLPSPSTRASLSDVLGDCSASSGSLRAKLLGEAQRPPLLRITRKDSPEDAGVRARAALGLTVKEQTDGRLRAILTEWRQRIEDSGSLVFQFPMHTDEVSGFSLANGVPAIVLNKRSPSPPRLHSGTRVGTLPPRRTRTLQRRRRLHLQRRGR